ncbi:MAG: DNA-3-methyladenine glycosylase [Proteobacteria bacterium]|nr:MAG: DNA-3-methyladenine glycosylase [Pseudomonadota bacterium]
MFSPEPLKTIPSSWLELKEEFFSRPAPLVAEDLIGTILLKRTKSGYIGGAIVETEAYAEDDEASHSFKGQRPHNSSMYGPPGMLYVYRSYGIHWCLNFSTGKKGHGEAVLIRALAATFGTEKMIPGASPQPIKFCSGPGRLCAALSITRDHNGLLVGDEISLWKTSLKEDYQIATGQRIGISKALEKHWRFGIKAHPSLSKPFPKS